MKFNRQNLLQCLKACFDVAPRSTSIEALKYVLLTVDAGDVTVDLSATDGEGGILLHCPLAETATFSRKVALPRKLMEICSVAKSDEITLELEAEHLLTISADSGSVWELQTLDPEDFSSGFANKSWNNFFTVQANILQAAVEMVAVDADTEAGRFALQAVCLELADQEGTPVVVSTDGRRLAKTDLIPCELDESLSTVELPLSLLVPVSWAKRLRVFDPDTQVQVTYTPNMVAFANEEITLWCTQIEGRFPQWRKVVPEGWSTRVHLEKPQATSAIRQARIVNNQESRGIALRYNPDDQSPLILYAQTADVGHCQVQMVGEAEGGAFSTTLDGDYFLEAIQTFPAETICLLFSSSRSPIVFTDAVPESIDRLHLLMPLSQE